MRTARTLAPGPGGIYHVILRGNNKQIIFESSTDAKAFMTIARKGAPSYDIEILCVCLMSNHVHMLLRDRSLDLQGLSAFMRYVTSGYVRIFNKKHNHLGHVFQGRFFSEPVLTEHYYMNAFRYILKNPEKAGIAAYNTYPWSTYRSFSQNDPSYHPEFTRSIFENNGVDPEMFLQEPYSEKDEIPDIAEYDRRKHSDDWVNALIHHDLKLTSGLEIQQLNKEERNAALKLLHDSGASYAQIRRMTGIEVYRPRKRRKQNSEKSNNNS